MTRPLAPQSNCCVRGGSCAPPCSVVRLRAGYRWVQKFGPELTKRTEKHLRRASLDWHVDESYIRVGGTWRYLWRAVDANGQMVDFRLTARRDARAAKAFLNKAIERVRLHRPVTICTDKAQAYRRVIRRDQSSI
nr:DDE-type integrase/transposase/recombinase [Roseovarius sp. M141]